MAALVALLVLTGVSQADGTATVGPRTLVIVKGWGLFPAPYDRQLPVYAGGGKAYDQASWLPPAGATPNATHRAVGALGFTVARVYISPTIGRRDGTLDPDRLQDLKDHLALLKSLGVGQYIFSNWSPPASMKLPDHVRFGISQNRKQFLDPQFADGVGYDYADFIVAVAKALRASGLAAPLAVCPQNEPDVDPAYDGCVYTDTDAQKATYRAVLKQLRARLDAAGFGRVVVLGTDQSALAGITSLLGAPSPGGFAALNGDPALRDALGGFSFHTYATAGNIKDLNAAMAAYPGKDRWMTEYSTETGIRSELRTHSGSDQLDWAFNDVRRMGGDLVDLRCNYWFFWRGYHSASAPDNQDLVYDGPRLTKAACVFQKLWRTVRPGWAVKECRTTDPDLRTDNARLIASGSGDEWSAPVDILAFQSPGGKDACLLLANWKGAPKTLTAVAGLRGAQAQVFTTTATQDMTKTATRRIKQGALSGPLSLPPYSITLLVTAP